VLIVGLLVLSLLAWAVTSASGGVLAGFAGTSEAWERGLLVRVSSSDGRVYELPLGQGEGEDEGQVEGAEERLVIETSLGSNTVVVHEGRVFVEEADCPGGDCLRQGGISRPGQTIVCLPHRLVVEIVRVPDVTGTTGTTGTTGADVWVDEGIGSEASGSDAIGSEAVGPPVDAVSE
jgi:hypothetical protein